MAKDAFPFLHYYQDSLEILDTSLTDSTQNAVNDSIRQDTTLEEKDSIQEIIQSPSQPLNTSKIDSLFKKNEEREKQIKAKEIALQKKQETDIKTTKTDTPSVLYELFNVIKLPVSDRIDNVPDSNNFLFHIPASSSYYKGKQKNTVLKEKKSTEHKAVETIPQIKEIPRKRENSNIQSDWITFVLIFLFLLIGWSRLFFKKYFHNLIRSFHFYNYAQILYNESNSLTIRSAVSLNINYFIVGGLFIFQTLHFYNPELIHFGGIKEMFFYSLILISWYIWNYLMAHFVGAVFKKLEAFHLYFQNYNLYRKIFGLAVFPMVVTIQFTPEEIKSIFIYSGILLFGIVYLMHILRGLQIFMKKNISLFYLILYLCALEFLPILAGLKLIKEGF